MNHILLRPLNFSSSVLLAHTSWLVREGITGILQQAGFVVLDQTDAIDQLQQMVRQQKPDILLLQWELLERQIDTLYALATEFPACRIVIFSPSQPPPIIRTLLEAGASGYLSLNLSSEEFIESLNIIAKGDIIISQGIVEHLARGLNQSNDQEALFNSLSSREREVLPLIVDGLTNGEIASILIITVNTVKVHLRNILDKLDLRNRQQLAAVGAQGGFFRNPALPDLAANG